MTLQKIIDTVSDNGFLQFILLCSAMCVVDIAPIKINPWGCLLRNIGRLLNKDLRDEFKQEIGEIKADNARYRILRFDDELRHNKQHSEEHYNQVITDINMYMKYCEEHPRYPNEKATMAIENIKDCYKKCREKNNFI